MGHDAFVVKVAKPVGPEVDNEEKRYGFDRVLLPCKLVVEPERNIFNASDVKLAIGLAAAGSGWLWFPS